MNVAFHPETINILSICTGGAGLDLGIELALPGARAVCMVEREAFAVAHLVAAMEQGLLAPAPVWSDARTFDGRAWRGLVDGLIGGIPCQPHSLAGKRLAAEDERDLWSTTRRIIVQVRPWIVLIENVGGMLSSGGAERVWRDLGRLGFEREIGLFTAAEVGPPHERERLFILGMADAESVDRWSEFEPRGARCGRPGSSGVGSQLADASGNGCKWSPESNSDPIEPEQRAPRRCDVERCNIPLVDTTEQGLALRIRGKGYAEQEHAASERAGGLTMADPDLPELRRESPTGQQPFLQPDDGVGLFPPGPGDAPGWRRVLERAPHLEPAFRRVADGLASRLDVARVDRLRMLGNGVVPLEAAYAFRALASRLARRSAAAARLVRMMEGS